MEEWFITDKLAKEGKELLDSLDPETRQLFYGCVDKYLIDKPDDEKE